MVYHWARGRIFDGVLLISNALGVTMAKMIIDLQKGLIEIEGDEKFVERVYSDLREATLDKLSRGTFDVRPRDEDQRRF